MYNFNNIGCHLSVNVCVRGQTAQMINGDYIIKVGVTYLHRGKMSLS